MPNGLIEKKRARARGKERRGGEIESVSPRRVREGGIDEGRGGGGGGGGWRRRPTGGRGREWAPRQRRDLSRPELAEEKKGKPRERKREADARRGSTEEKGASLLFLSFPLLTLSRSLSLLPLLLFPRSSRNASFYISAQSAISVLAGNFSWEKLSRFCADKKIMELGEKPPPPPPPPPPGYEGVHG